LITGDLGYGVLDEFQSSIPNQFLNFGITEQSMMSAAAGLAQEGYRPFVYSIANFPTFRCLEQIRNDICYMNLGVTIVAIGAGFSYGTAGYSHHLIEDISSLRALSNLEIFSPADPVETENIVSYLARTSAPAYLRLGRGGEPNLHKTEYLEQKVNSKRLLQGSDPAIFFTGSIGGNVIKAADLLNQYGFYPSVFSISQIHPMNLDGIDQSVLNMPILTVEEHILRGGFGSAVLEETSTLNKNSRVLRLGIDKINYTLAGSQDFLRDANGLGVSNIAEAYKILLYEYRNSKKE
jgi:transketolase